METAGLIAGLLLPWLLGVVWLRARWFRAADIAWTVLLGYGYLAGLLATTLIMRLLDLSGLRLTFISVGAALLLALAAGLWASHGTQWRRSGIGSDWRDLARSSRWHQAAFAALLLLMAVRLASLGLEVVWRPLFPWDAWSQWADKARVWYEFGRLVPFVRPEVWLSGQMPGAYSDLAPHYPPAIPLLQVWMCLSLGRWDDSLMNLPWLFCAVALGLAFYGQARRWQAPPLTALMFCYFLLSLPLLNVHVALAGYADLFMATSYGLAAMAFFHWSRRRGRWDAATAMLFAAGCALIKQPGLVWMLTFLPALIVVVSGRSGLIALALLAGAGVAALAWLGMSGGLTLFGYDIAVGYKSAWEPLLQNLLLLDNWHLLWYLVVPALALSMPHLLVPALRGMTVLVAGGFLFLFVAFFLTQAQVWAEDYTTLNRAILHIVPSLLFYLMVLYREAIVWPAWLRLPQDR